MKFVYFGSSKFSKEILEGLTERGIIPSLIITKPDKPKGRGLKLQPTEISIFADSKKITCVKPQSLESDTLERQLEQERADLFIIADYGKIVPKEVLSLSRIFAVCVHPSLLPYYRGSTPIEQAIINGDNKTGVTIFRVNQEVDAGDIIIQKILPISNTDDFISLREKLAKAGVLLLVSVLEMIENNNYKLAPQDPTKVTLTYKLKKEDGKICWKEQASVIRNLIRATLNWPTAYTYYKDLMIQILSADVIKSDINDYGGRVIDIDKEGINVATSKDILRIKKLKPQGKKEMDACAFVSGYRVKVGDKFG